MSEERGHLPGRGWIVVRRITQSLALLTIVIAPVLGGWQRLDRTHLASWDSDGMELPRWLRDQLPMGNAPGTAYDVNQMLGGGLGVDYVGVPLIDPVAGVVSLLRGAVTPGTLLAFVLPLLLALVAGRAFCGWFCPFGTISRAISSVMARLPFRVRRFELPASRPIRWLLLGVAVLAGVSGFELVTYLALPHLLVQQSVYAAWLLGGGSAVLGVLFGLLLAGVLFGPTTYCATLCPTGALLTLPGRRRIVRLQIASPKACGAKCHACDLACWLGLDPSSGDPGPDCDLCTRCFDACRRTNLRVGIGHGARKASAAAAILLAFVSPLAFVADAEADDRKPAQILHSERDVDGVTIAVSVVDFTGVRLDADDLAEQSGIELSVFVARGERLPADEHGMIPRREVYDGPLTVHLDGEEGRLRVEFDEPSSPVSTPTRSIYRRRLDRRLWPGDEVVVSPVQGWVERPQAWVVPPRGVQGGAGTVFGWAAAAVMFFAGLLALALAAPKSDVKSTAS